MWGVALASPTDFSALPAPPASGRVGAVCKLMGRCGILVACQQVAGPVWQAGLSEQDPLPLLARKHLAHINLDF